MKAVVITGAPGSGKSPVDEAADRIFGTIVH